MQRTTIKIINPRAKGYYADASGLEGVRRNGQIVWFKPVPFIDGSVDWSVVGSTLTPEGAEFVRV